MAESFIYNVPPTSVVQVTGEWVDRAPDIKTKYLGLGFVEPAEVDGVIANMSAAKLGIAISNDFSESNKLASNVQKYLGIGNVVNFNDSDIRGFAQVLYLGIGVVSTPPEVSFLAYNTQRWMGIANNATSSDIDTSAYNVQRYLGPSNVLAIPDRDIQVKGTETALGIGCVSTFSDNDYTAWSGKYPRWMGRSYVPQEMERDIFTMPPGDTNIGAGILVLRSDPDIISLPRDSAPLGIANHLSYNESDLFGLSNNITDEGAILNSFGGANIELPGDPDLLAIGPGRSGKYGPFLRFKCDSDSINILTPVIIPSNWLFSNLSSFRKILQPKNNRRAATTLDLLNNANTRNDPNHPSLETPRLLTHLIFDPITKPAISTYYLTYILDIAVAPTPQKDPLDFQIPEEYRTDSTFEYYSTEPSNTWTIHHQLGYIPRVVVFVNDVVYSKPDMLITQFSENTTIIQFAGKVSGVARLS